MKKQAMTLLLILSGFANTYAQSYPEMITVEGGTFTMGDKEMEGDEDEQPTHQVTLKTFKIARTETTVAQWRAFCDDTGCAMPEAPSWGWINDHPIVNINYGDAVAYCDWLAERLDAYYSLPTEAEWEYAARGGKQSNGAKYSGGSSLDNAGWYEANSNEKTHPVATKKPNELGIYDMNGNVWEWCKDWYGDYSAKAQTNPKGVTSGSNRVIRGGSWGDSASSCRFANRNRNFNGSASRDISRGFRVVLSQ
jgi:formylglycine-generating enzyme required for sulfatase activity